ncbi:MFS transporter [Iodidimonas sp. SYSU 1G8]|uniref:MFS transporter n=1 Tax=Iodidimonas sp. SYSU 1G8 TaxID=3133967 RepID=UPI0031FE92CD
MTGRSRIRSLAAIVTMIGVVGLVFGLTGPLLNLLLERQGLSGRAIGLNGAMTALGALVFTPFIPSIAVRVGPFRLLFGTLAATALILVLFKALDDYRIWLILRFMMGVCVVVPFLISEIWINQIATPQNRGRLLGIYAACISTGFGLGPLLMRFTGVGGWTPFLCAAGLVTIAMMAIAMAREDRPYLDRHGHKSPWPYIKGSPIAILAGLMYGAIETGIFGLLPVYGVRSGFSETTAATQLTVIAAGNILLQYPVGWLADKTEPRRVLMLCAVIGVLGGACLPALKDTLFMWPVLFIWGGTITGMYTVALTMLGHRYSGLALASANAALILAYNTGAMGGPPVLGQAMDLIDPDGLVYGLAGFFLVFVIANIAAATLGRRSAQRPTDTGAA